MGLWWIVGIRASFGANICSVTWCMNSFWNQICFSFFLSGQNRLLLVHHEDTFYKGKWQIKKWIIWAFLILLFYIYVMSLMKITAVYIPTFSLNLNLWKVSFSFLKRNRENRQCKYHAVWGSLELSSFTKRNRFQKALGFFGLVNLFNRLC